MDKQYDQSANVINVSLYGEVDIFNANDLKDGLSKIVEENNCDVMIDCESLKYIDSTGLGVLVSVLKRCKEMGLKVKLINLKPHLYKIFELTDLHKLFEIEVMEG